MSIYDECTGDEYPLAVGTIRGLRTWEYQPYSGALHSVTYDYIWNPNDNLAYCGFTRYGRCAREHCGCGFWAYHDGSEYPCGNVTGIIDAWGPTTVGTKGFRAQNAKILALCVNASLMFDHERTLIRRMSVLAGLLALTCVMLAVFQVWGPLLALSGVTGGVLVGTFAIYMLIRSTRGELSYGKLTKEDVAVLQRNYPGIPVYSSQKKMLKDFPLTYKKGDLDRELEEAA